jgi:hypothetical protein
VRAIFACASSWTLIVAWATPPSALTPRSRLGITCPARTALLETLGATERERARS